MAATWFGELDELLRGKKTQPQLLAQGTDHLRAGPYVVLSVLLGIVYGLFMGLFAVMNRPDPQYLQLVASAIKVPALFYLTLLITFPSLYVFSALLGARLSGRAVLRVIICALAVNLTVLASFGPITGFFTLTTKSYAFIKLLNVAFFTVSGFIGLGFLSRLLRKIEAAQRPQAAAAPVVLPQPPPVVAPSVDAAQGLGNAPAAPALPPLLPPPVAKPMHPDPDDSPASGLFRNWLVVYAIVGAQMAWILRPFIGTPGQPFEWFRARESNFFIDVLRAIGELFK